MKIRSALKFLPLTLGAGAIAVAIAQSGGLPPGTHPYVLNVPPSLPPPPITPGNPLTVEGVALGQRLFNEKKLSGNNTQACSSCHVTNVAFSNAPNKLSKGIDGKLGTRNAMALFNLSYQHSFFWDGRSPNLRAQALQPIQNPVEMHTTLAAVISKLSKDVSYVNQFKTAFGTPGITAARIGAAIEQVESTILSGDSKFDRVQQRRATFTAQEQRGADLFRTPFNPRQNQFGADCARCHGGPLFSNFAFRNNGLDAKFTDLGLGAVTGNPADNGKFKTPSLRNIAITGPYMHDGRFATLEQVVAHYSNGIVQSPTLDPGLARQQGGVHLSAADQAALVAFMKTLTDNTFRPLATP